MMDGSWAWGDWFVMSLVMAAFWGLLVGLILWLVRTTHVERESQRYGRGLERENADELLAQRFAAGEIDSDEFVRRRELLHTAQH